MGASRCRHENVEPETKHVAKKKLATWTDATHSSTATILCFPMADKAGAYGTKAADTDFRKKWDKEEYAERAKKRDLEEKERMQENEERMKQGKF